MKRIFVLSLLIGGLHTSYAQQYITRTGSIEFLSATAVENIQAKNKQVSSVLDMDKGEFAFLVPIKAFQFEKALMQEHFNENYMESDKFPNGSFKGKVAGLEKVDFKKDGNYPVTLSGTMNIHGEDKELQEQAVIAVKGGKVSLSSNFVLKPGDYGVKIPSGKKDSISDTLDLTVNMDYEKK